MVDVDGPGRGVSRQGCVHAATPTHDGPASPAGEAGPSDACERD